MISVQPILVIIICLSLFFRFKLGVILFLVYFFLQPFSVVNIGFMIISNPILNLILLLAFIFHFKIKNNFGISFKPFTPFIYYYILILILCLFRNELSFNEKFKYYSIDVFSLILPIVIWNLVKINKISTKTIVYILLIISGVILVYGLCLLKLDGLNPYVFYLAKLNNVEIMENQFGVSQNRMMAKISSVFPHPMTYGLFLGMILHFILFYKDKIHKAVLLTFLITIVISIFTCGIRTPIASLFFSFIFFSLYNRNFKILFSSFILIILSYYILIRIPGVSETVLSIIDSDSSNVSGSSIQMRLEQLNGVFNEIKGSELLGNGYGWTNNYLSTKGIHPDILAFESIIFVLLCNTGFIGMFLWLFLYVKVVKNILVLFKDRLKRSLLLSLIVYYISYAAITGEYGYFKYFLLFYTLIISSKHLNNNKLYEKNNYFRF